jgi:NADPH2:quinone reductase
VRAVVYRQPGGPEILELVERPHRVGKDAGLPLHVSTLTETAEAHRAVQDGAVGKVLVDVTA